MLCARLHDEYPERMLCTYSVSPSPRESEGIVEPYNCLLAAHQALGG